MIQERLIQHFGNTWYNLLKTHLMSREFLDIGKYLKSCREGKEVYPKSENVFRVFKETPFENTTVLFVAMDPYPQPTFADGLAFSNSLSATIAPSLRIILEEVENCYPENKDKVDYGRLDKQDLVRWSQQGVFLFNAALTVEKGSAGSHLELWKNFTTFVLEFFNKKKQDLIVVLFGKEAEKFEKIFTNSTFTVLKVVHPAAHAYRKDAGFLGNNLFKKINEELILKDKNTINW